MDQGVLPLIQTHGSSLERGQQQGEAARQQILASLENYRQILQPLHRRGAASLSWEEALQAAGRFQHYAEAAVPEFMLEVRGIAEGSGTPFQEVWALHCYEELAQEHSRIESCTCLAVSAEHTADGHTLLAHNEDWLSADEGNAYLVHAQPDNGPCFLGLTYGPLLPNIGLNAEGIAVAINSVYATDERPGIPRILYSRAVLGAQTVGQAVQACLPERRAGGYNYLIASASGELRCVETSALAYSKLDGKEGWLAHTNHYLTPVMQALEQPGSCTGSHLRLSRAQGLISAQLGGITVEGLQGILRDHANRPASICSHPDPADLPYEQYMTVASLVMDLTAGVMWAATGPPCTADYVCYAL
jgi:isopenicillin-N N-acyltransferase-like protein